MKKKLSASLADGIARMLVGEGILVPPEEVGPRLLQPLRTAESAAREPAHALTVSEACERLRCSRTTLWRMVRARQLRCVRLGARSIRVPEAEIRRLLGEGCR